MKLNFKPDEIKEIIELYYRTFEGKEVTANITFEAAKLGYGMSEYDGCLVTFSIIRTVEVFGKPKQYEERISEKELKKIFEKTLKGANFIMDTFHIDAGSKAHTTGYGMTERTEKQAYFNGITVEGNKEKAKLLVYQKEGI